MVRHPAAEAALLVAVALTVRGAAAWALGEGAPFGPDGTGAEAAVVLGGHLYPAHVAAIGLLGSARTLSVVSGAVAALALWFYGRRLELGPAGGWLAALLPVGVYTGALSAGDAPALAVVCVGAAMATFGRSGAFFGGALALASALVKPVALPALVLLLARPWSLFGVAAALPLCAPWLRPLWAPLPDGGLLGSWWRASEGHAPAPGTWFGLSLHGLRSLATAPLWTGAVLLPVAIFGGWRAASARAAAVGPVLAGLLVAASMGDQLHPRYLEGAVWAALPWVGALLPRWSAALLLWPTFALVTQVGAARAEADPAAAVPALPVLPWPVDAGPLFDEASTPGATTLRDAARDLARTLPEGATVQVQRRPHGREGELAWPLRVARPDLEIEVVEPGTPGAW